MFANIPNFNLLYPLFIPRLFISRGISKAIQMKNQLWLWIWKPYYQYHIVSYYFYTFIIHILFKTREISICYTGFVPFSYQFLHFEKSIFKPLLLSTDFPSYSHRFHKLIHPSLSYIDNDETIKSIVYNRMACYRRPISRYFGWT